VDNSVDKMWKLFYDFTACRFGFPKHLCNNVVITKGKLKMIAYPLSYNTTYARCLPCEKLFVVDSYVTYHFCNYCQGSLVKE
jgi:hypothetical protein